MSAKSAETGAIERAAEEHAEHIAQYATQYDGKGGVKWQDDGGLRCSCGWTAQRTATGYRPWSEWHAHVVRAVLAVVSSPGQEV